MSNLPPYDPNSLPPPPPPPMPLPPQQGGAPLSELTSGAPGMPGMMGQSGIPNYYLPHGAARPGIATAVAVLALIFGPIGVLCGGLGLVGSCAQVATGTVDESGAFVALQLALALVGFGLSVAWIVVGIGLLGIKRWAFSILAGLALADIVYGVVKLVVSLINMPAIAAKIQAEVAKQSPPPPGGVVKMMTGGIAIIFVVLFIVCLVLPILGLIAAKRAEVRATYLRTG